MKTHLGRYDILNRQTRKYEKAELFEGIDEKNLIDFEREWKPAFERAAGKSERISMVERIAADAEDIHWDWKRIA